MFNCALDNALSWYDFNRVKKEPIEILSVIYEKAMKSGFGC